MKKNNKKLKNYTDRKLINLRLLQIRLISRLNAPDLEYKLYNLQQLITILEEDEFYDHKLQWEQRIPLGDTR